jgi:hypothetical protein
MAEGTERRVTVSDELVSGVYADAASIHTNFDGFTLDFLCHVPATSPPEARVTARVHLPPAQVWQLTRMLTDAMSQHEAAFGPIKQYPDAGPLYPPFSAGPPTQS